MLVDYPTRDTLAGLRGTARRWSAPAAANLADQTLYSGAHFGCHILLARLVSPSGYGAFVLAYALFLLGAGVESALILEPMLAIGPSKYAGRVEPYLRTVWRLHWIVGGTVALALAALAGALAYAGSAAGYAVAAAAVMSPFALLFWLSRHSSYMRLRPQTALKASAAYALLIAAGLWLLWKLGWISAPSVLLLMGSAGLLVGFPQQRGARRRREEEGWRPALAEVWSQHWEYGKWSLARFGLTWAAGSIYLPFLGALGGLVAVGTYRAAENLTLPMSQVLTALGLLWLPAAASRHARQGNRCLRPLTRKMAVAAAGITLCYLLPVLAAGRRLGLLAYGDDRYAGALSLLPCFGAALILRSIADTAIGTALRAAGRPDLLMAPVAAATATTLTLGLALAWKFGATGAAAGLLASAAAGAAGAAVQFRRNVR